MLVWDCTIVTGDGHCGQRHQGLPQQLRGPSEWPVRYHQQLSQQENLQGQRRILYSRQETSETDLQVPQKASSHRGLSSALWNFRSSAGFSSSVQKQQVGRSRVQLQNYNNYRSLEQISSCAQTSFVLVKKSSLVEDKWQELKYIFTFFPSTMLEFCAILQYSQTLISEYFYGSNNLCLQCIVISSIDFFYPCVLVGGGERESLTRPWRLVLKVKSTTMQRVTWQS